MSKNPFETVLNEQRFTEEEKKVFMEIIHYAKSCQKTGADDLKSVINKKIEEVLSNEVS